MRLRQGIAAVFLGLLPALPAAAQTRETVLVDSATAVFHEIMSIPESSIPPALLSGAQGLVIIPSAIKAGFLVGGRFGRGIVLAREASGTWGNPVFVTLGGGSFGFQAGAQATDLILVFRNRRALDTFLAGKGKFTLGADASVAAGPLGRNMGAATDARLTSEILTYSRSRGLFAGVSLEGAVLSLDWQAVPAYYGGDATPADILAGAKVNVPASAARLKAWLARYAGPTTPAPPAGPPEGEAAPAPPGEVPVEGQVLRSTPAEPGKATASGKAVGRSWRRPGSGGGAAVVSAEAVGAARPEVEAAPKVLVSQPTGVVPVTDPELSPATITQPAP